MPFNPLVDIEGDGSWTDLEADTDSQHAASPPHPESSASPSPHLRAQIIDLSEDSDQEDDVADLPNTSLNNNETINADGEEDVKPVQPENGNSVLETTQEKPENLEPVDLLTEFLRNPTKRDTENDDRNIKRENLRPRESLRPPENPFDNNEVGQATRADVIDLECEFCLRSHKRCDGFNPVCGLCSRRRRECIWPSVKLTRAEFHKLERERKASSFATSSPNDIKSPGHTDPRLGRPVARQENAATTFHHEMERTLNRMAEGEVDPYHEPGQNKDLVFSDVLPEAQNQNDPGGGRDNPAHESRRTVQYLDLCDSDSTTTPPRDNSCHHCIVGKKKSCNGERPCQSCFKYGWRCFDLDPKLKRKYRPRKRKSEPSQARRTDTSSKPSPIKSNTRDDADETSHETESDVSLSERAQPRYTAATGSHPKYHPFPYDDALIRGKRLGLSSNQIKVQMNLQVSSATLRHRWLHLVKWGIVEPVPQFPWRHIKPLTTEAPILDNKARSASLQGVQRTHESPEGAPRQFSFDCAPCRQNDRHCSRRLPCTACLDHGQGQKCYYKGDFGGGGGSAKHLYQTAAQASPSVPSVVGQGSSQLTKVRMRNADRFDTRTVFCDQCTKCHSTCDTMLPCDRCELRGIGHLCSYSDRYVPVIGTSFVPNGTFLDEVAPAITRSVPPSSAQSPSKGVKIRMVNADPNETRVVFCDGCTKCHQPCDANLPCSRCEAKGAECSYSKRYIPAASENGSTSITDSGYSTLSPITSALLVETKPNRTPSKSQAQPITRNIISDSESDGEMLADIVHEEDPTQHDTIQVSRFNEPNPSMRGNNVQVVKTRDGKWMLNSQKRKASLLPVESFMDLEQPPQKRARRGSDEAPWRPSGGGKATLRRSDDRPITRLSTSAVERRSYAKSPTAAPSGWDKEDDLDDVRPEDVPSAIREVFANMPKDVFLDAFPDASGRGARPLGRLGTKAKQPDEYSTSAFATSLREKRAAMSDLEAILMLRENADATVMRRVMKAVDNDPLIRWENMGEAEQEALRESKRKTIIKQRDDAGRSANYFANQILKLATSCVGETAILQFLMQSRKARLKVIGLLDDLVSLEEDGRLKLKAGRRGIAKHEGESRSESRQQPSTSHDEHDLGPENLQCEWQGITFAISTLGPRSKAKAPNRTSANGGVVPLGVQLIMATSSNTFEAIFPCHRRWSATCAGWRAKLHMVSDGIWGPMTKKRMRIGMWIATCKKAFRGATGVDAAGASLQAKPSLNTFAKIMWATKAAAITASNASGATAIFLRRSNEVTWYSTCTSMARYMTFKCKICGRGFRYNWELNKHAQVHEGEDEEEEIRLSDWGARAAPKISKEPLYSSGRYDTDDDEEEKKKGDFTCRRCGRDCTNAQGLGKHMTKHAQETMPPDVFRRHSATR
ncbi:hypothetical protein H2200_000239 [Cladophialophora chaetospira]|uniref:Zn(2)-C6 fungal-type domain-containing protein n=1 Tax=Cladophialophora chaetospira TaxID=386627 RepID=A0AA38XN16_9EURO|nr:hypothetical protein H2200_000239 [Cladophialophora chaetospira]